jgi:hypothetical protein
VAGERNKLLSGYECSQSDGIVIDIVVIQVIDSNSASRILKKADPPIKRRHQLNHHCLHFPQHFPEKGFCDGRVDNYLEWWAVATDATSRRGLFQSAVSSSPEQCQEPKGVNKQGIGWSGVHGLRIGRHRLSR